MNCPFMFCAPASSLIPVTLLENSFTPLVAARVLHEMTLTLETSSLFLGVQLFCKQWLGKRHSPYLCNQCRISLSSGTSWVLSIIKPLLKTSPSTSGYNGWKSHENKLSINIAFMVHAFYIFLGPRCQAPSLLFWCKIKLSCISIHAKVNIAQVGRGCVSTFNLPVLCLGSSMSLIYYDAIKEFEWWKLFLV